MVSYEDLYDRQIRTYGRNVNNKILNSSILIVGLENKYIYEYFYIILKTNNLITRI